MSDDFERQSADRAAHACALRTRRGGDGTPGANYLVRGRRRVRLPGKTNVNLKPGDRVRIETPGGGAWGKAR